MKKLFLLFLLTISLTGCISLGKSPSQNRFMLNMNIAPKTIAHPAAATLQVNTLSILPQYAGNEFVYRTSEQNYLTDYYNVFFISPDLQLTQITADYLTKKKIFAYVGNSLNLLNNPTYTLNGTVMALYADYRNRMKPTADISIHFYLMRGDARVVLDKTYTQAVPLQAKNSTSLVNAWNVGMTNIMYNLSHDLSVVIK